MTDSVVIRPASAGDIPVLARQRPAMYRDMGVLPAAQFEPLRDAFAAFLARALPLDEYLGWVAETAAGDVVAGAGLHLRSPMPGLRRCGEEVAVSTGPHGLICNVFTEPTWRRRGVARRLIEAVISGARARGVTHLFLHASAAGRPLYEALGFVPSNEMRYSGPL